MFGVNMTYRGNVYTYSKDVTFLEISKEFQENYQFEIIAAKVNGKIFDLSRKIERDCDVEFLDLTDNLGNKIFERGLIYLLAKAVKDVYNVDIMVQHSVNRIIHTVIKGMLADDEVVSKVRARMLEIVEENMPFERVTIDRLDAIEYFTKIGRKDKADGLRYISNSNITLYRFGQMYDYYFGEMPPNSSCLNHFTLDKNPDGWLVMTHPRIYQGNDLIPYVHRENLNKEFRYHQWWCNNIGVQNVSDLNKIITEDEISHLIYLGESNQNNRMWDIAKRIHENRQIRAVLIAGPSSSGKTTTSKKLGMFLRSMGLFPHEISTDDYFLDREHTPLDEKGKPAYETLKAVDMERLNRDIQDLMEGKPVRVRHYNFLSGEGRESNDELKLADNDILIIEGLHTLSEELKINTFPTCRMTIYVSSLTGLRIDDHNVITSTDFRLLRRIIRDHYRRGYNVTKTLASWQSVREAEEKYIFPYLDTADVVFSTFFIYEIGVLKLYVEPLLYSVKEDDPQYPQAIRLMNLLRNALPINYAHIPHDSILREFIGESYFE